MQPTLAMMGRYDADAGKRMSDTLPNAEIRVLEYSSHGIMREEPEPDFDARLGLRSSPSTDDFAC